MKHRWLLLAVSIIALAILIFWASLDWAGAAPACGNLGGCAHMRTAQCEVSDAGRGYVSGVCAYGYWFSRVSTGRMFRVGQAVTARGCEGEGGELYAPIRISR